jgi:hypothetical protein
MLALLVAFALGISAPAGAQGNSVPASPEEEAAQRAVLMELFAATDGPHWKNRNHWDSAKPVCEWYGVGCGDLGYASSGPISYLRLAENGLRGPLPASLATLPFLVKLELAGNELTGAVPASLLERFDKNLLELNVSGNGFSNVLSSVTIKVEAVTGFCHASDQFLRATLDGKRGRATCESQRCESNPKKDTTAYCLAGEDTSIDLTFLSRALLRLGFAEPNESGTRPDHLVSDHDVVEEVAFTWGDGRTGRASSTNGFGSLETRMAIRLILEAVPSSWPTYAKRVDCRRFTWLPR